MRIKTVLRKEIFVRTSEHVVAGVACIFFNAIVIKVVISSQASISLTKPSFNMALENTLAKFYKPVLRSNRRTRHGRRQSLWQGPGVWSSNQIQVVLTLLDSRVKPQPCSRCMHVDKQYLAVAAYGRNVVPVIHCATFRIRGYRFRGRSTFTKAFIASKP